MREEPTWFARWEEDLPSPEELMPLTQTLITPDLALAFDIPSPGSAAAAAGAEFLRQGISHNQHHLHNHHIQQKESAFPPSSQPSPAQSQGHLQSQLQQHHLGQAAAAAADYDSSELGGSASGGNGGAGSGGDEQARTLKRPRLVWTPQLHKRFVDAVAHLGIKNAVPKTIMQLMSVEGLTRENVASHLQKYRLYLKRMQGLSGGPGGGGVGQISHADSATEQLFASGPVPHPLLHHRGPTAAPVGAGGADQYFPFASMGSLHPHQPPSHQQQMAAAAAAAAAAANYQQQQQYYQQHRQHQQQQQILGSPPGNGFDHGLFGAARQQTQHQHHPAAAAIALQRMMAPVGVGIGAAAGFGSSSPFGEDLDSGVGTGGAPERRKELTLFPTNDG